MHRNVVPAALLFGNIILGLGCSDQKSEQLAQPIAPVLPPVKFEFTATANRVAADQVLINIVDSSDDGAKILTVGRPTIDQFHDVEASQFVRKSVEFTKYVKRTFLQAWKAIFWCKFSFAVEFRRKSERSLVDSKP